MGINNKAMKYTLSGISLRIAYLAISSNFAKEFLENVEKQESNRSEFYKETACTSQTQFEIES